MPTIGITYRTTAPVWGATQVALALAEAMPKGVLIDTSYSDTKDAYGLPVVSLDQATGLDLLVDIDGLVSAYDRARCAARTVVFLRDTLAFTEMDASVYLETDYARRSFEGVSEIWCWDLLNTETSLDPLRVMFPCPVRRVPFVWTPRMLPSVRSNTIAAGPWSVHIAERNLENTSSCVLPLVIARHLYVEKFPAVWTVHHMGRIRDRKFLKENVLDNIEAEAMGIQMKDDGQAMDWTEPNAVLLSHARFTPLSVAVLDALWLGLPVIHNSAVLRDLCPALKETWYHGNSITDAAGAFRTLDARRTWPAAEVREALRRWGEPWANGLLSIPSVPSVLATVPSVLRIAFADMWPGFNEDANFFMDALRHFGYAVKAVATDYDLLIFGPYGETWRGKKGPRVYFSAENWATADHAAAEGAVLSLTCRPEESPTHLRIPTWMTFVDWFSGATELPADSTDNPIRLPVHFATHPRAWGDRSRFCAFVVSNPTCAVRNAAFEAVHAYQPVSSGGALFNNIGGPLALKYPGGGGGDLSKHAFFAEHRYTISFENSQAAGYVTEKLLHAKMAGCIPLYWGDAAASAEFVPHSFVNLSANPSAIRSVIEKLDSSPMAAMIAATPLLDAERVAKAVEIQRVMCERLASIRGIRKSLGPLGPLSPLGIAQTFVIHLDHRHDRKDSLLAAEPYLTEWEAAGSLEWFSATNGKTLKMTEFIYQLFARNEFQWKKSIIGCNMSHIGVWDRIASSPSEGWHLVLEDDVRFVAGWRDVWADAVKNIPADAELLYLGGVLPPNKAALPLASAADNTWWAHIVPNTLFGPVEAPVFHFCAYSYLLTRRGARKILDYLLDSEKKSFTVSDHLLGHPSVGLRKYHVQPLLSFCFQESDPVYVQSAFNDLHREDTFDSDIWNNRECFTEEELAPFRSGATGSGATGSVSEATQSVSEATQSVSEATATLTTPTATTVTPHTLTVYYCTDRSEDTKKLYELAWLEDLFGVSLSLKPLVNVELSAHSWFLVQRPHVAALTELFGRLDAAHIPFHVLHLSDEFEQDDVSWYELEMCQSIIRNYPRAINNSKVHVVPLGYHHRAVSSKPWEQRELVWSFHGTDWFDRGTLLEGLTCHEPFRCHLQPHWNHPTATREGAYLADLGNSRFCPILKGQHAETFRMYEALEAGTLPIAIMEPTEQVEMWVAWIEENMGLSALYPWTDRGAMTTAISSEVHGRVVAAWEAWKGRVRGVCRGLM